MSISAAPASSITPTHKINIRKEKGYVMPPDSVPDIRVGDTIRLFTDSPGDEVKIKFDGPSPFRLDDKPNTEVPGEVILTVVRESTGRGLPNDVFVGRCTITLSDGTDIGWGPGDKQAGIPLNVRRP